MINYLGYKVYNGYITLDKPNIETIKKKIAFTTNVKLLHFSGSINGS